ncbi:MAG: metallophosphoesterase [Clostridia bacterium]|nr:metallophosphoesterase [Clostridia bacterium]
MPFRKSDPEKREKKEIRSMKDAVAEIASLSEDMAEDDDERARDDEDYIIEDTAEKREIRSMSEAVEAFASKDAGDAGDNEDGDKPKRQKRVYGDGHSHRADESAKSPRARKHTKKKKRSLLMRLINPDKKIRRSDSPQPLTLFGYRLSFWPMFLAMFVVLMVLIFLLNSTNLTVDDQPITLMALSPDAEGYRMLVLSDLNGKRFGDKQATLLREIDSLDYDIVVCLGDMVGEDGDPSPFYELLEGLPSSKQVYFICGDSDPGPYAEAVRNETAPLSELVLADWILGAVNRGAIYVDRPVSIALGAVNLWLTPADMLNLNGTESVTLWKEQTAQEESGYLAGIDADRNTLPFTNYRYLLAEELFAAATAMSDSDIHVSLSHVPPSDEFIESTFRQSAVEGRYLAPPDIVLAGHYCGGVWNVPLLGAFYVPDSSLERYGWFPSQDRVSGLREIDLAQIYVTRGLSSSGDTPAMPFRLLNAPEISIVEITATSPQSMLE